MTGETRGIKDARAVVVMVTVAVAAFEPSRVTVGGETGASNRLPTCATPGHVWLNPPEGAAEWKNIFEAAESAGGAEYYLIEQEGSRFPELETARRCLESFRHIHPA